MLAEVDLNLLHKGAPAKDPPFSQVNDSARDPLQCAAVHEEVRVPYDLLVNGGTLSGLPSTVVDLGERRILRRGARAEEVDIYLRDHAGRGA